jgi:hypothetical protein
VLVAVVVVHQGKWDTMKSTWTSTQNRGIVEPNVADSLTDKLSKALKSGNKADPTDQQHCRSDPDTHPIRPIRPIDTRATHRTG